MRKATKTIISFAVVLIAGLNFIIPAFAQDPFTAIAVGGLTGASGAGLFGSMAGMSGIDVGWSQSGSDPMDAMWNVLNPDHVYFSGEKHEADPQTYPDDVWDYINVDIGDWLSAQSDFIVNFAQTYNVDDNDSGTITSTKNYKGYPLRYSSGTGGFYGDSLGILAPNSSYSVADVTLQTTSDNKALLYVSGTYQNQYAYSSTLNGRRVVLWQDSTNRFSFCALDNNNSATKISGYFYSTVTPATNIPWTSQEVNLSVFDGWGSAKVKIPHSISQLQAGWTVPEFLDELDRIWSGAGHDNIVIEDGDQPVPPVPVPDTPLGEVPFDDWVDLWGQGIYQQLENQSDVLDLIGSNGIDAIEELESIDTNTEDLVEVAESIDTNIGVGNGILGGIRSLAQSAVNYLEGIVEHVGELVEEIVEGTETLIAGILNQIPQAFGVIFGPIKQASSIWHYVVEWIISIGAPFQFIWSMASGTSYYVILPVYASLAAAVVLAFFKRFGR